MEYIFLVLLLITLVFLLLILKKLNSKETDDALKKENENLKNMILQQNSALRRELNST